MIYLVNLRRREVAALPDGREWRGPNAIADTARALIGEGVDPGARLVVLRDARPALEGTIGGFASRQWAGANTDPKLRRWCPHPQAQMPPRLVQWAIENGFVGPGRYPTPGSAPDGPDDASAQRRGGSV